MNWKPLVQYKIPNSTLKINGKLFSQDFVQKNYYSTLDNKHPGLPCT